MEPKTIDEYRADLADARNREEAMAKHIEELRLAVVDAFLDNRPVYFRTQLLSRISVMNGELEDLQNDISWLTDMIAALAREA